ncbi:myotilin [Crotalus adamanteus]|uniref:Myotilin n=1 Tax=Crotalus adamanteus TaxID=8729 RepID=A0AAW1BX15_CROAD
MYSPQTDSLKQVPKTSDREIQGTKDALIQDLERKLRCKDNLLHNGNQRLSYEERMARRLLGPENAASMFVPQNEQNAEDTQQNMESVRLQVPPQHVRNRPSSRGERNDQGSIQEKFFPPRFLQVPEDVTVEEGRFCRLDFKVSGLPIPDVAWYLNGRLIHPDDFHKMIVSEKGFHSFIFEVVRVYDAGTWECVSYNRAGEASFSVKIDVIAKEHRKAPAFISKAQSTKVYEGDSARLECQVSAIPPPQIYWKRNNEMVQFNTDRISMFHDAAGKICLLIHDVNKKDAGWYTVSAVNEAGVATCHARLDVATHTYKPLPNPKPLKVRPTFSKYLALNGKGVNVKQAFFPDEGEYQRMATQTPKLLGPLKVGFLVKDAIPRCAQGKARAAFAQRHARPRPSPRSSGFVFVILRRKTERSGGGEEGRRNPPCEPRHGYEPGRGHAGATKHLRWVGFPVGESACAGVGPADPGAAGAWVAVLPRAFPAGFTFASGTWRRKS